jgi:hypothetical protein
MRIHKSKYQKVFDAHFKEQYTHMQFHRLQKVMSLGAFLYASRCKYSTLSGCDDRRQIGTCALSILRMKITDAKEIRKLSCPGCKGC